MTRNDVLNRLGDEVDTLWPGEQVDALATGDDLDALTAAFDAALDECRGYLESQFSGERVKES